MVFSQILITNSFYSDLKTQLAIEKKTKLLYTLRLTKSTLKVSKATHGHIMIHLVKDKSCVVMYNV